MCLHCGASLESGQVDYCCPGCEHVHTLLGREGLDRYYELRDGKGQPVREPGHDEKWLDLIESDLRARPEGLSLIPLDVEGLHCTGCVWLISELFQRTGATGNVVTNPARGSVDLWVTPEFPLRDFVKTVGSFGYGLGPRRKKELASSDLVLRMGLCIAIAMNAMIFAISVYAGLDSGPLHSLFHYLTAGLAVASFFIGGTVFIKGALSAVRRGVLHLDLPIALGIILGYAGSTYSLLATRGDQSYFDTLTVFIALMLVGRFLRERVLEKNRSQLLEEAGPLGLLVRRLGRGAGEAVEIVAVSEVKEGDRLLIAPGDVVPVAAKLDAEKAVLSMEWITGEAEPLSVARGATVVAGAANAGREAFEVEATATFEASGLLDLLRVPRAVDRYGDASTPFEARLARLWVILVLIAATIGFVAWFVATKDVARSLGVSIGILVVTCPCAFGIATPIAHEIVLGGLRRAGLLVRSASFLDRASSVRRVVFDKTGTLTTGSLRLAEKRAAAALPLDVQTVLYNLASRSSHPKAEAVKLTVTEEAQRFDPELRVTEHPGRGLSARHDGAEYRLGAPGWVGDGGSGDIAFGRDGETLFSTTTEEELRHDAEAEVGRLGGAGLEVWMLTGDRKDRAAAVAQTVRIPLDHVVAECSPERKATFLQERDHNDTLMIGDGINDAMAVRTAHCSGTPGAGRTFLAARTDFYLLGAGLAPVRMALKGAKALRAAIRRNLAFAAAYNVGAVALALAGLMTPLLCAVLMPLSSITSIALAVRALGGRDAAWKS